MSGRILGRVRVKSVVLGAWGMIPHTDNINQPSKAVCPSWSADKEEFRDEKGSDD